MTKNDFTPEEWNAMFCILEFQIENDEDFLKDNPEADDVRKILGPLTTAVEKLRKVYREG